MACDNDNRTSNKIKLFLTHLNGDAIVSKSTKVYDSLLLFELNYLVIWIHYLGFIEILLGLRKFKDSGEGYSCILPVYQGGRALDFF